MIYCEKDIPSCSVIIMHACLPDVVDKDLVIKKIKPLIDIERQPYLIRAKTIPLD